MAWQIADKVRTVGFPLEDSARYKLSRCIPALSATHAIPNASASCRSARRSAAGSPASSARLCLKYSCANTGSFLSCSTMKSWCEAVAEWPALLFISPSFCNPENMISLAGYLFSVWICLHRKATEEVRPPLWRNTHDIPVRTSLWPLKLRHRRSCNHPWRPKPSCSIAELFALSPLRPTPQTTRRNNFAHQRSGSASVRTWLTCNIYATKQQSQLWGK